MVLYMITGSGLETDGVSWCREYGGPTFRIVPNTGCSQYVMHPNANLFHCYPGLVFSVKHCGCDHRHTYCTLP